MSNTFVAVVILPSGYSANGDEVAAAIAEHLTTYAPGSQVAAHAVDTEDGVDWAGALLVCNAKLDNLREGMEAERSVSDDPASPQ